MTKQEVKTTAETIISQLGGRQFQAMTGSIFGYYVNSSKQVTLSIKFKGSRKCNCLLISLNENDLYNMEFLKYRNFDFHSIAEYEDVYFDQLQSIFTRVTGLYTHL